MEHRKYRDVQLSKKETEVVAFLETGSNNFWEAFYDYKSRKQRFDRPTLVIASWFNRAIASLHKKGIFKEIPFVLHFIGTGNSIQFIWMNPGINASKANFECLTLHDAFMEEKQIRNKIII